MRKQFSLLAAVCLTLSVFGLAEQALASQAYYGLPKISTKAVANTASVTLYNYTGYDYTSYSTFYPKSNCLLLINFNRVQGIKRAIIHIHDVVSAGKKLSEGLKEARGIFPSIMIKVT